MFLSRTSALAVLIALGACVRPPPPAAPTQEWPVYGGDDAGQRFSQAAQITPANVKQLRVAWTFSTGDLARRSGEVLKASDFEATPIQIGERLYACTPFNEAFALDPASGRLIWRFDAHIDTHIRYPNRFSCRGVAYWRDPKVPVGAPCAERILMATNDRRLIALDAATGKRCAGFGDDGVVDTAADIPLHRPGEMQITSAPTIIGDVVVIGSSIDDNQRVKEVSGAVRAFDVRSGRLLWRWDPLEGAGPGIVAGAANVWAPMSADPARGLVFLPTTSPSPDFWGGMRPGNAAHADSVVALDGRTGRFVWAFQTVHHDVWDYDNPAQPTLGEITWRGQRREVVLQPTKQGLLFTLDRTTGAPVIPVEERPTPQGGAPGETLSPTQPFPLAPAPLAPSVIRPEDAFGLTPFDRRACRDAIAAARHEGLFTPPSLQGTLIYPFTGGGSNWGGIAFDPRAGIAYVNTSNALHRVALIPKDRLAAERRAHPDWEISDQEGAPYGMSRQVLKSPIGIPCNPPPWGRLHAIDMNSGRILWSAVLGTTRDMAPGSQWMMGKTGTPNFGGPVATAGGLVFIGAAMDNYLRAFDARTGRELWKGRLPGGGQATPMTYVYKGRQYVVISAGGHGMSGTRSGDRLVAFAL